MLEPQQLYPIISQVSQTWEPPVKNIPVSRGTCVQTAFMQALALVMDADFPWDLMNDAQTQALVEGLAMFQPFIGSQDGM